jgi:calcineurin-like phosphoesterase family protein
MTYWYTADPHFGHENIIRFCQRPFPSAAEMDAKILANYARCVRPADEFWIIGDFSHGRQMDKSGYLRSLFDRVPGKKHLVTGNHDNRQVKSLGWDSVHEIAEIKDGEQSLTLCHYPMITWNHARRGSLQLFGHVHQHWQGSRNSINVGVDVWNFEPVQISSIQERAKVLPVNQHWHHVERNTDILGQV